MDLSLDFLLYVDLPANLLAGLHADETSTNKFTDKSPNNTKSADKSANSWKKIRKE